MITKKPIVTVDVSIPVRICLLVGMTFFAVVIVLLILAVLSWILLRANEEPSAPANNALPEMEKSLLHPERPDSSTSTISDLSASCCYSESKRSSSAHRVGETPFRKEERVWGLRKVRSQTSQWTFCKLLQGSNPESFAESESYLVHFFSSGIPDMWLSRELILHNTEESRADIAKFSCELKRQRTETLRKLSSTSAVKVKRSASSNVEKVTESSNTRLMASDQHISESKDTDENFALVPDDAMLQTKESTSRPLPGGDPEKLCNSDSSTSYSAAG